jgi:hypothetical protein
MSFVLAQKQGWKPDSLTPTVLGPFQALRNGVTGYDASHPDQPTPAAEFFMWEHFTTKPYFHTDADKPHPPLKKIGEIFTPWPSWLIVASTSVFPDPEHDEKLQQLFHALDQGIKEFGCTYVEEDAKEWLKDVRFTSSTRGVDRKVVDGVVDVLKVAGVIDSRMSNDEAAERVIGIPR